jgi:polysaccharide pyruvyl transferase WcaK-like protein
VAAVGVGPIRRSINKFLVACALNRSDRISVRDKESLLALKKLPIHREVSLAADPVLALEIPRRRSARTGACPKIALVPRNKPAENASERWIFARNLSQALSEFAGSLGGNVFIVPFHPGLDREATELFKKELNPRAEVIEWSTPEELLDDFSAMDFAVTMRYHGAIVSAMMGIPAVGIEADPKIGNFYREILLSSFCISETNFSPSALLSKLRTSWGKREEFVRKSALKIPAQKERARRGIFPPQTSLR